MAEVRIKDIDEHEVDTILAEDIDFEGHLSFKKPLMIKGKFKGEIKSTSALYVGEKAYLEAKVEANLISSKGKIRGDMVGHSRVELFSTAQVDGDINAPDFVVESGCKFNGYCNMGGGGPKKDASHHQQQPAAQQPSHQNPQGQPAGQQPSQAHGPQQAQGAQQNNPGNPSGPGGQQR